MDIHRRRTRQRCSVNIQENPGESKVTRFLYIGFECGKEILSLERKLNMFQVNIKQVKAPKYGSRGRTYLQLFVCLFVFLF